VGFVYKYWGAEDKTHYDLLNAITDPKRELERFMESVVSFEGVVLVDIGAGGGYHACTYAEKAGRVFAIEPAPKMLVQLYGRVAERGLTNTSVVAAGAADLPLRDNLVDVVHSRFAYFFGPEQGTVRTCEPGISEALRILKSGGYFFIIDNALTTGHFSTILARYGYTKGRAAEAQAENDAFYARHGFRYATVETTWSAPDRQTLQQILTIDFSGQPIDEIMAEVDGAEFSYHCRVYYQRK
jgi:ubiquinone/menaquinone biosynthesis C-methylase UbiE